MKDQLKASELYAEVLANMASAADPLEMLQELFFEFETSLQPIEVRQRLVIAIIGLEMQNKTPRTTPFFHRNIVAKVVHEGLDSLPKECRKWILRKFGIAAATAARYFENEHLASGIAKTLVRETAFSDEELLSLAVIMRDGYRVDDAMQLIGKMTTTEAKLIVASCHRLKGNAQQSLDILAGFNVAGEGKNSQYIESAMHLAKAYRSGEFHDCFKHTLEIVPGIEDPHWLFARQFLVLVSPHGRYRSYLRKPAYLYRVMREAGLVTPEITQYRDALIAVTELRESEEPLYARVNRVMQEACRPWAGSVEVRLHFLMSAYTTLISVDRPVEAEIIADQYRQLSLVLSGGFSSDAIYLLSFYRHQVASTGSLGRKKGLSLVGVSTTVGTHALKTMANRWRHGVAQSAKSRHSMQEAISQVILNEFQKNRGFWQKLYQTSWGIWSDLPLSVRDNIEESLYSSYVVSDDKIKKAVETALGKPRDAIFSEWHSVPIGSGSFGQVHRARLKSGEDVAVKVQYPDAKASARADMRTLKNMGFLLEAMYPDVEAHQIAKQIKKLIDIELDYTQEVAMMKDMDRILEHREDILIPKRYEDLCADTIITMEHFQGKTGKEFCQTATQEERDAMGERLLYSNLAPMATLDRFLNEIHFGNYLFADNKLCITDFGAHGQSVINGHRCFFSHLHYLTHGDFEAFIKSYVEIGYARSIDDFDHQAEIDAHLKYLYRPYLVDEITKIDKERADRFYEYRTKSSPNVGKMRMPPEAFSWTKNMWSVSATASILAPRVNMKRMVEPLLEAYVRSLSHHEDDESDQKWAS